MSAYCKAELVHQEHINKVMRYYTIIDFNEVDIGIYLPEKVIIGRGEYHF